VEKILRLYEVVDFGITKKRVLVEMFLTVWAVVKLLVILSSCYLVVLGARTYHSSLPVPMKLIQKPTISTTVVKPIEVQKLEIALKYLNCPKEKWSTLSDAILKAAQAIRVQPEFVAVLIFTESRFNMRAVSSKGYKGLLQTPMASKTYADVDVLYGCRILEEKMKDPRAKRNGQVDMRTVLALYKGGYNKMAFKQADEVLTVYKRLQQKIKENIENAG
jgi:soluble lytic murein transglycosylase-like protein